MTISNIFHRTLFAFFLICIIGLSEVIFPNVCPAEQKDYLDFISDALTSIEAGNTPEGLQSLGKAITANANDPIAHVALGLALLSGNRSGDARDEFSVALDIDPQCAEATYGLGLVSLVKGDMGHAISLMCQAQETKPDLDMRGSIEYVKAMASGIFSDNISDENDDTLLALKALSLMKIGNYEEAIQIWKSLQPRAVRPGFGERIGCTMTFVKSKPVALTGWGISKPYRPPSAARSKLPVISGTINLKADLSKAGTVSMVSFFVDGKLVGMTNTSPFYYSWDTRQVPNGTHMIKVQGLNSDAFVLSEKSTEVLVRNTGISMPSALVTGSKAKITWNRLWNDLKLKPSAAAINYNLAICALRAGDKETAVIALERVMAANPSYLDAAQHLIAIYHPDGSYRKIYRGNTQDKLVALSFDDGPKADTGRILDILKSRNIKATFFLVGKQADIYPDTVKRIAAEGHEIENHTYNHRDLEYITETEITQEYFKTCATVRSLIGKPTHYLRPPGGHEGKKLPNVMKRFGLPTVYWTTNCSAMEGTSKKRMTHYVVSSAKPGSIILMHNLELVTALALPDIIDTLKSKGYTFVTLNELEAGHL